MTFIKKPKKIIGKNLIFKNATVEDASFIVSLRTDISKSRFISSTSTKLNDQILWLNKYQMDESQVYFIITDMNNENIGTVRLYGPNNDYFCWGSWILKDNIPSFYSIESALIIYTFALNLGFKHSYFTVDKGNESVWKFHEKFGAHRTNENEREYYYEIDNTNIINSLNRYKKYLPNEILISF